MSIYDWSTTPGSNTTIDSVDISEGCAPSGMNDAVRAVMADIAQHIDDVSGQLATAGSSNTYTATTAATWTAYADRLIVVMPNHTNTGAATLNVDSLGAKAIKKFSGASVTDVAANDLVSGNPIPLFFDSSADYFIAFGIRDNTEIVTGSSGTIFSVESTSGGANFDIINPNSTERFRSVDGRLRLYADQANQVADSRVEFLIDNTLYWDFRDNGKFYLDNATFGTAPSSVSDTGTAGEIRITTTGIFICTATNTWRTATGGTF